MKANVLITNKKPTGLIVVALSACLYAAIILSSPVPLIASVLYLAAVVLLQKHLKFLFYLYFLAVFFIPISIGVNTPFILLNVDRVIFAVLTGCYFLALLQGEVKISPIFIDKALGLYWVAIAGSLLVNIHWIMGSDLLFRSIKTIFVLSIERMLIIYIVCSFCKDKKEIKRALIFFVICLGIVAAYGIFESAVKDNIFTHISTIDNPEVNDVALSRANRLGMYRAKSTQVLPHIFGTELCMIFPIVLFYLMKEKGRFKLPLFFILLLVLGGIAVTYARGVYLALSLVCLLCVIFFKSYPKRVFFILTVGLLFLALFSSRSIRVFSQEYVAKLFNISTVSYDREHSMQSRFEDYAYTAQRLENHLWLGQGYGTYTPGKRGDKYLDNSYLFSLIETGLLGFCALLFLIYSVVFKIGNLLCMRQNTDSDAQLMRFVSIGFIVFFFQCFTYDALVFAGASKLFWAMLGFIIAYLNMTQEAANGSIGSYRQL